MGAAEHSVRLRSDSHPAILSRPVVPGVEFDPVAEHQRAVTQKVGQLRQSRRLQAFDPARVDDLDRHAHRIDQRPRTAQVQGRGANGIHRFTQAQGHCGLDAAQR